MLLSTNHQKADRSVWINWKRGDLATDRERARSKTRFTVTRERFRSGKQKMDYGICRLARKFPGARSATYQIDCDDSLRVLVCREFSRKVLVNSRSREGSWKQYMLAFKSGSKEKWASPFSTARWLHFANPTGFHQSTHALHFLETNSRLR